MGGFKKNYDTDDGQVCSDVEVFRVGDGNWTIAPSLNVPRSALACVLCENIAGFN